MITAMTELARNTGATAPAPYPTDPGDHEGPAIESTESPGPSVKTARVARAFRGLMDALDLDASDPHLRGTEWRVARAYEELLGGLLHAEPVLRTFPNEEGYAAPVSVTGIPFYSLCAHHFLPFFGEAHIVYMPANRLVGLSKLARAVDHLARRPQVQERLTEQLAALLDDRLQPAGVMVVLEARHLCMEMRGARSAGQTMTSAARGVFTDVQRQQEFLASLGRGRTTQWERRHGTP